MINTEWDDRQEPNDSARSSGVTLLDDWLRSRFPPVLTAGSLTVLAPVTGRRPERRERAQRGGAVHPLRGRRRAVGAGQPRHPILFSQVMPYEVAIVLSHGCGMLTAYALTRLFVFERSGRRAPSELRASPPSTWCRSW